MGGDDGAQADGRQRQVKQHPQPDAKPGKGAGTRAALNPAGAGEEHVLTRREIQREPAQHKGNQRRSRDIRKRVPDHVSQSR